MSYEVELKFRLDQVELVAVAIRRLGGVERGTVSQLIAEDHEREAAESAVWELAGTLGLTLAEPRSYLDLMRESDAIRSYSARGQV